MGDGKDSIETPSRDHHRVTHPSRIDSVGGRDEIGACGWTSPSTAPTSPGPLWHARLWSSEATDPYLSG